MEQTHHFEQALTTELARLVEELENLAVHNSTTDDWEIKTDTTAPEEADESLLADAAEQADTDVSLLAELENQYRHIKLALLKINTDSYGICEIGSEVIDTDRLLANPAARTCREHMNDEAQLPL